MDEDATTNRTKWSLVEVKIEHGLTEKIEGKFSLWQKKVSKARGKCGVDAG